MTALRTNSGAARRMIIEHEGLRLKPYRDSVGKLTIGVGRNLDDVGISEEEALSLLDHDIGNVLQGLEREPVFHTLSELRRAVLTDMAFNLGLAGLKEFRLMYAALADADFERAAAEMLDSTWAGQVGRRAKRLAKMMAEDRWFDLDEIEP